jgi:hypothetical protein
MGNYRNKTNKNNKKRNNRKKSIKKYNNQIIFDTSHEIKSTNCSPIVDGKTLDENSCLTPEVLLLIKNEYNKHYPTEQILSKDPREIWNTITYKLSKKGCKKDKCILNEIKDEKLRKNVEKRIFAPEQPVEWETNPDEWLSNYDIFNVLHQYEQTYPDFKFIGPTTIDFDTRLPEYDNKCVEDKLCEFDLKKDLKKGYQHFACVFNLDKHYQSGSHWVSIFVDIPEKIIFYFDSAGATNIPPEITILVKRLQKQSLELEHSFRFKFYNNSSLRHQNGNTECGMYALFFVITMLTGKTPFYKNKVLSMKERIELFMKKKIPDEVVFDYRDLYFNPKNKD